jgi:DNA-binding HxlR family transcriptional regulator
MLTFMTHEPPSMTRPTTQLGVPVLELLARPWMVSVLSSLAEEAARPAELELRLPGIGHSVVIDRLQRLFACNLVTYERRPGTPPLAAGPPRSQRAVYALTEAARMLLPVVAAARGWERAWRPAGHSSRQAELRAISLSADRRTRSIALGLAARPLSAGELGERSPGLSRSALRRRLRALMLEGLLERRRAAPVARYALTVAARQLALPAAIAGQWEWRWVRPRSHRPTDALRSLLELVAPLARAPGDTAEICRLRVDTPGSGESDLHLEVRGEDIRVLAHSPAGTPAATGGASPDGWCEVLLGGDAPITVVGDRLLLDAVIAALRTALTL